MNTHEKTYVSYEVFFNFKLKSMQSIKHLVYRGSIHDIKIV